MTHPPATQQLVIQLKIVVPMVHSIPERTRNAAMTGIVWLMVTAALLEQASPVMEVYVAMLALIPLSIAAHMAPSMLAAMTSAATMETSWIRATAALLAPPTL